jgi:hypothetical protein
MNKIVRLIALMLALLTLSGMFAACANSNDPETTTEAPTTNAPGEGGGDVTEAETLYVEDDLEDKYEFGETITMLYWEEFRMHEFFAEESGDIIEDAIFHRNIKVAERLGIEFEFIAQPGDSTNHTAYVQQAENDWAADNAYDIYAGYSRTIPLLTIKKMTANLLEQDAFNVNKPWWPEALTTECTIKDQLYFCTGDISTSMLWYMIAFMYNKELYENHIQNGGKTPMDMVDNDEWTLQNFLSLVQDLYIDTNNDGQKDINDFYGATIYSTDIDSFMIGAGITSLEKDESGALRISEKWNSQRCADICETVGEAIKLQGILCNDDRTTFKTQQSVFHMDRVFNIPGTDSGSGVPLEFSVGVVPVPKFDETQLEYKTNLGNPFTIYALNAQSDALVAAATTLEAMGSENYRSVTPAVFEVAMKVRYTDDPQVADMFDILKENVSFDVGKLYYYTMEKTTSKVFSDTCLSSNPSGFLSVLKTSTRVINNKLKTLMAAYE